MYWSEESKKEDEFVISDNFVDVVFSMQGKTIPLDNAYVLSKAIEELLPWLVDDEQVGIHHVFGAESGNGWLRPENTENEILYLSKRQKLTIRSSKERLADIQSLTGQTLNVDGHEINVGKSSIRKLSDMNIVFARNVIVGEVSVTEDEFMNVCVAQLKELGINVKKMMCGRERNIQLPNSSIITRGLMIADLEKTDSVKVQEQGIGVGRKLGCGLFLPQKGIDPVNPD